MDLDIAAIFADALRVVIYSVIGIIGFGVAFNVITRLVPFSMQKEIEDDQNDALGWIVGAVMVGLAFIVAAAVGG